MEYQFDRSRLGLLQHAGLPFGCSGRPRRKSSSRLPSSRKAPDVRRCPAQNSTARSGHPRTSAQLKMRQTEFATFLARRIKTCRRGTVECQPLRSCIMPASYRSPTTAPLGAAPPPTGRDRLASARHLLSGRFPPGVARYWCRVSV